jgi:hypothetical protein
MSGAEDVQIREITQGKSAVARDILTALPAWFGIPESLDAYVRESAALPMLGAIANTSPIGFLSLKEHNCFSARRPMSSVLSRTGTAKVSAVRSSRAPKPCFAPAGFASSR